RLQVAAQQQALRGNRGGGGAPGGGQPGGTPAAGVPPAGGNTQRPGGTQGTSRGDVALAPQQQDAQQGQGRGGFQMPDVSDADCAKVTAAFKKKPAEQKKMDDLRAQMQSGAIDRQAVRPQM